MTWVKSILGILHKSRHGLTAYQIAQALSDYGHDFRILHTNICQMKKRGMVRRDGSNECPECGSTHAVYRITEKGRMHLNGEYWNRKKMI